MDATIIFWEITNLVEGLQYKIELLTEKEIDAIESKMKSEVEFVIKNLENCPLLIINRFTSFFFSAFSTESNKLDNLSIRLNKLLESFSQSNLKLINLDKIIANLGVSNSFNPRYYYSSKSTLYSWIFQTVFAIHKAIYYVSQWKSKKSNHF